MIVRTQFLVTPRAHRRRQKHRPETNAFQACDLGADRFPQAPDFAVFALEQNHGKPGVSGRDLSGHDVGKSRFSVLELDPGKQLLDLFIRHGPADSAQVFAVDLTGGVHHPIGQFSISGQQQQPGRVEIQATDGDPASV